MAKIYLIGRAKGKGYETLSEGYWELDKAKAKLKELLAGGPIHPDGTMGETPAGVFHTIVDVDESEATKVTVH